MSEVSYLLIVDDSLENLNVLGSILIKNDYKISLARDGLSALQIMNEIKIDLVLLDIMMPDMDGYEVCALMKKNPALSEIPVIFISALNETKDIVKGFKAGGIDYITKPFKSEEVIARVETHLRLRNQNRELKKLNADKDLFVSILAHDLKNPFHTLLGFAGLLKENIHTYDISAIERKVDTLIDFLSTIYKRLEDSLLFTKSQSGRINFFPRKLKFSKICSDVLAHLKLAYESKNINIQLNIHSSDIVFADEFMLKVIIDNLLMNAIKFSNKEGLVTLSSYDRHTEIAVEISDNGVGIKPNEFDKLFDITKLYSTKGTANEQGTGLGLILCKDFVERHGGKIKVESEPGKGTKFAFNLPLGPND